jgi:hypothetical protein
MRFSFRNPLMIHSVMPRYKTCISARILLFGEQENTTGLNDLLCKRLKIPSIAILPSYPIVFLNTPYSVFLLRYWLALHRIPPFEKPPWRTMQ